jgi:hypothetical protein
MHDDPSPLAIHRPTSAIIYLLSDPFIAPSKVPLSVSPARTDGRTARNPEPCKVPSVDTYPPQAGVRAARRFFLVARSHVRHDNRRTRLPERQPRRLRRDATQKIRACIFNEAGHHARASMRTPVCGRVAFRTYARHFPPRDARDAQ